MSVKSIASLGIAFFCGCTASGQGQKVTTFNLRKLLEKNKLQMTSPHQEIQVFVNPDNQAITTNDILWIKDLTFKEGTIDIDLRGKNGSIPPWWSKTDGKIGLWSYAKTLSSDFANLTIAR